MKLEIKYSQNFVIDLNHFTPNLEHFWGWLSGLLEYFGNQSKHFGNKSKILAIIQEDLQAKIHTVLQPIKSSQNPVNQFRPIVNIYNN